ncbi:TadE/TadG family type IV pilus assembly protein [Paraburkholderia sediminicola]|uniref:TadE/TadG family type IV pilus assembly protein n=1 Tax=Paraburkholderia sediminicola TaxID=458836 RepID=UPI0038BBFE16
MNPFRDTRGAVTPMFAVSIVLMLMALLGGIDTVRFHLAQSRLQYSLDAAAIGAGGELRLLSANATSADIAQWKSDALAYFTANMPANYLGSSFDPKSFTVALTGAPSTGQYVTMSAQLKLPLVSAGLLKLGSILIPGSNQTVRTTRSNLEVALVLDNTGSMIEDGKITALIASSKALVKEMFNSTSASSNSYMGIVPFATTVNVGNTATTRKWMSSTAPADWAGTGFSWSNWGGCTIEPRASSGNLLLTPTNPATHPFKPYYYKYEGKIYNWGCVSHPATFLTSNTTTLNNALNALKPPKYSTVIPEGLLWGWRMLSPLWKGSAGWGHATLPQDPASNPYLTRVVVLLSDGGNEVITAWDPSDVADYPDAIHYNGMSGINRKDIPPYGTTDSGTVKNYMGSPVDLDNMQTALCTAMKKDGIIIYTIRYGGTDTNDPNAAKVMTHCASSPENAFDSPDPSQLQNIFSTISGSLSELRLVK